MKILALSFIASIIIINKKYPTTQIATGIYIPLPQVFHPMSDHEIIEQSPSVRSPLAAYTNDTRDVDFTVSLSATQWPDGNRQVAQRFFKTGIQQLFDNVNFVQEKIITINKNKYIFFEFESRLNANRLSLGERPASLHYHHIYYLIKDNRTLVFSFHYPLQKHFKWKPIIDDMIHGLVVNWKKFIDEQR